MTESNQEHISSLMDGELDREARQFLLRRLSSDAEMSSTWRRYHLIRACMHQELASPADLTDRVRDALEDEPLPARESQVHRWMKPLAGSAIAASVAVAAIVGINTTLLERGGEDFAVEAPGFVSQSTSLDQTFSQPAVPVSYSEVSPADRQRINTYLLRHNQAVGGGGFASYVPIVTGTPAETPLLSPEVQEQTPAEN